MSGLKGSNHIVLLRSAQPRDPYEAAFREAGFTVRSLPVLTFAFVNESALRHRLAHPTDYAGLVVTSPRAVEALAEALRWLPDQLAAWQARPIFAVGPRTTDDLEEIGFEPEGEESGTAEELAAEIARGPFRRPLLFLCGNRRRDELPMHLEAEGVPFEEVCVYETLLRTDLNLSKPTPDWMAFFSPSGVEAVQQAGVHLERTRHAAIGPTTAEALAAAGLPVHAVAARPTPQALVEAVREAAW